MKDAPELAEGQYIRVVLEGRIACIDDDYVAFAGSDGIITSADEVKSIEVLRTPISVGDELSTEEDLDALPKYSAVHRGPGFFPAYKIGQNRWTLPGAKTVYPNGDIVVGGSVRVVIVGSSNVY